MAFQLVEPNRQRRTFRGPHALSGIAASIKSGSKGRLTYLIVRINPHVMEEARLLIGDTVDVFFDNETRRLAFRRNPTGSYVIRAEGYTRKHMTATGQIKISNILGLNLNFTTRETLEYAVDDAKNPSILLMQLPERFFTAGKEVCRDVFAELRAA